MGASTSAVGFGTQKNSRKVRAVTKATTTEKETVNETAVKVFKHITDAWGFNEEQKLKTLLMKDAKELKALIADPEKLSETQMGRVSYIFHIYDDLHALLQDKESADSWLERTHKSGKILLRDKTPLQAVLSGDEDDIKEVASYLATVRHR